MCHLWFTIIIMPNFMIVAFTILNLYTQEGHDGPVTLT